MRYSYICETCIVSESGKPLDSLDVATFNELCSRLAWMVQLPANNKSMVVCPRCGGEHTKRLMGSFSSYERGYGYQDKAGVRNDMNLYTMTHGKDPYAEHRKPGDKGELVGKLRRNKRIKPKRKDIYMR